MSQKQRKISRRELADLLAYDRASGQFFWKTSGKGRKLGRPAGAKCSQGYTYIGINRSKYRAHRLVWFVETGEWPGEIDHINGDRSDNRFCNLRPVTRAQNNVNSKTRADNSSGHRGVSFDKKNKKWRAYINVDGRQVDLGRFAELSDAVEAQRRAAIERYGEYVRPFEHSLLAR